MAEIQTTKAERDILQHSLCGSTWTKRVYRNFFCVAKGSPDELLIIHLIELGLMAKGPEINDGRDYYAFVTAAGAAEIGVKLPKKQ